MGVGVSVGVVVPCDCVGRCERAIGLFQCQCQGVVLCCVVLWGRATCHLPPRALTTNGCGFVVWQCCGLWWCGAGVGCSTQTAVTADPADINVLPEYGSDPRTVNNLLDGVGHTRDDLHVWLAPFTVGQEVTITVKLDSETTLSMLRLWNYNKSRIHSYRGVRQVIVELDGRPVFEGEVRKAPGCDAPAVECSEVRAPFLFSCEAVGALGAVAVPDVPVVPDVPPVHPPPAVCSPPRPQIVLFTLDNSILQSIEAWDTEAGWAERDYTAAVADGFRRQAEAARPTTPGGTTSRTAASSEPTPPVRFIRRASKAPAPDLDYAAAVAATGSRHHHVRPVTAAVRPRGGALAQASMVSDAAEASARGEEELAASATMTGVVTQPDEDVDLALGAVVAVASLPVARRVELRISQTWGDVYYAGLTGVQVLGVDTTTSGGPDGALPVAVGLGRISALDVAPADVYAKPRDINTVRCAALLWWR